MKTPYKALAICVQGSYVCNLKNMLFELMAITAVSLNSLCTPRLTFPLEFVIQMAWGIFRGWLGEGDLVGV